MTPAAQRETERTGAQTPPEEGNLVEVRGQSWVVARVEPSPTAADGEGSRAPRPWSTSSPSPTAASVTPSP